MGIADRDYMREPKRRPHTSGSEDKKITLSLWQRLKFQIWLWVRYMNRS